MPIPLFPPSFPVSVAWGPHTEQAATPEELGQRLVILHQIRAGLPILTDAAGRRLDAAALTRAALQDWYGD